MILRASAAFHALDKELHLGLLAANAKEQLDTKALDGLRGLAAFHVMISHYSAEALGLDLLGTMAMGLFYTLTGFVLYIGYARAPLADPVDARVCRYIRSASTTP